MADTYGIGSTVVLPDGETPEGLGYKGKWKFAWGCTDPGRGYTRWVRYA